MSSEHVLTSAVLTLAILSIGCTALTFFYVNYTYAQALAEARKVEQLMSEIAHKIFELKNLNIDFTLSRGFLSLKSENLVVIRLNDRCIYSFRNMSLIYSCDVNVFPGNVILEMGGWEGGGYRIVGSNNELKLCFNMTLNVSENQVVVSIIEFNCSVISYVKSGRIGITAKVKHVSKFITSLSKNPLLIEVDNGFKVSRLSLEMQEFDVYELIIKVYVVEVTFS